MSCDFCGIDCIHCNLRLRWKRGALQVVVLAIVCESHVSVWWTNCRTGGHLRCVCVLDTWSSANTPHTWRPHCVDITWRQMVHCWLLRLETKHILLSLFTDGVATGNSAVVSVRLCVRFHSFEPTDLWPWSVACVGHYHCAQGIETEGHRG